MKSHRILWVPVVLLCLLSGYVTGVRMPARSTPADAGTALRLQAIEKRLSASDNGADDLGRRQAAEGLAHDLIPALQQAVREAVAQSRDQAVPVSTADRSASGQPPTVDQGGIPIDDETAMQSLADAEGVLARAIDEGVWTETYDRAFNAALVNVPDAVWAQAQRKLAAAVNAGRVTLPGDFLPGL